MTTRFIEILANFDDLALNLQYLRSACTSLQQKCFERVGVVQTWCLQLLSCRSTFYPHSHKSLILLLHSSILSSLPSWPGRHSPLLATLCSLVSRMSPSLSWLHQLLLRLLRRFLFYPRHLRPRMAQSSILCPHLCLHCLVMSSHPMVFHLLYCFQF